MTYLASSSFSNKKNPVAIFTTELKIVIIVFSKVCGREHIRKATLNACFVNTRRSHIWNLMQVNQLLYETNKKRSFS